MSKQEIIDSVKSDLNELKESIAILNSKVGILEKRIDSNSSDIRKLKRTVDEVAQDTSFVWECGLLEEMEERLLKRKNLIFVGVPEPNEGSLSMNNDKDKAFVDNVVNFLKVDDPKIMDIRRIGRVVTGKSRLLRITCGDKTRRELLRKARGLRGQNSPYHNIFINIDRTRMQQFQFREKRLKSKERIAAEVDTEDNHQSQNFLRRF